MLTCIFENGDKGSKRHVSADALVIENNKILLVKRASHLTNPNKYALPGGFVDRDETIKQAVKREVLEETGYLIKTLQLFRINDNPESKGEDRQNIVFVYLINPDKMIGKFDNEIKEIGWFDLHQLPKEKDFAFDHLENIQLYLQFRDKKISIPILP